MKYVIPLSLVLAVFVNTSYAGTRADKRQERQEKRIDQGVKSGQLNEKEAARLNNGQARIDNAETAAQADGKITKKEQRKLENMQDRQSKKIYKEKHDRQRRAAK
jgi:polyhydroxyalkanoate synthesis regulator phasin